jgi:hypothetical protein
VLQLVVQPAFGIGVLAEQAAQPMGRMLVHAALRCLLHLHRRFGMRQARHVQRPVHDPERARDPQRERQRDDQRARRTGRRLADDVHGAKGCQAFRREAKVFWNFSTFGPTTNAQ